MIIYGKKTVADFAKCKKNINFGAGIAACHSILAAPILSAT